MVPENKKVFWGDHGERVVLVVEVARGDITLKERPAVDVNASLADGDRLIRQADHALDIRLRRVKRIPEDYDVAALDGFQPIDKLVDEDALVILEPWHHAGAFDLHRLVKEDDDNESQEERKDQVPEPVTGMEEPPRPLSGDRQRVGAC